MCVFVDGCQWHGCPDHYVRPRTREDFWQAKLLENVERDIRQTGILVSEGWHIYRVWEHEIWESLQDVVSTIKSIVVGQGIGDNDDWRVFRVDVIDPATDFERRYLKSLKSPETIKMVERIRTTRKWTRLQ